MSWGGLNPALTSWRNGLNELFPNRSTNSDGGYADAQHGKKSQHQTDADGSVDAFDEDVNYLKSGIETGSEKERQIRTALNKDFEADARAHLWIADRKIAQHDVDDWDPKYYGGDNPHNKHTHRQSHEQNEKDGRPWKFTHTKALLEEWDMANANVTSFSDEALAELGKTMVNSILNYGAKGKDGIEEGGVPDLPGQEASNLLGIIAATYTGLTENNKKIAAIEDEIAATRADVTTILNILTETTPETK